MEKSIDTIATIALIAVALFAVLAIVVAALHPAVTDTNLEVVSLFDYFQ